MQLWQQLHYPSSMKKFEGSPMGLEGENGEGEGLEFLGLGSYYREKERKNRSIQNPREFG